MTNRTSVKGQGSRQNFHQIWCIGSDPINWLAWSMCSIRQCLQRHQVEQRLGQFGEQILKIKGPDSHRFLLVPVFGWPTFRFVWGRAFQYKFYWIDLCRYHPSLSKSHFLNQVTSTECAKDKKPIERPNAFLRNRVSGWKVRNILNNLHDWATLDGKYTIFCIWVGLSRLDIFLFWWLGQKMNRILELVPLPARVL